jgi:signal transduction histidine kinase
MGLMFSTRVISIVLLESHYGFIWVTSISLVLTIINLILVLLPLFPLRSVMKAFNEYQEGITEQIPEGLSSPFKEIQSAIDILHANHAKQRQLQMMQAQREREQGMFFANASHELRTPLTTIQGYLDLMEDGAVGEITPETQQYINNMQQALQRITVMINNIIDLSKIEVGKFQVETLPFTVLDQIDFLEGQFEPLLIKKHQTLDVEIDDYLPELKGDPERFKQVLANLMSNAIKYTPDGGHIVFGAHTHKDDKEAVYFTLADTGLGIPQEDLTEGRLFSKFYQVRKGDARVGSGLGLAIVKELVQMMHGDIRVDSQVGTGTIFTIRMPIWQEENNATESAAADGVLREQVR